MTETGTSVWLAYLVFVVPTALAVMVSRSSEWSWFQTALGLAGWTEVARTRFAWDRAFAPEDPAWVLITFHSGALLGGKYASGAFASLETEARDLYLLEPHAVIEDGSWTPTGAAAAWIPTEQIALMEFFRMEAE